MSTVSTLNQSRSEYTHTIDDHAETSAKHFDVINPATGAVFASAPDASPEQLDNAVSAAQRAIPLVAGYLFCRATHVN